MEKTCFKCGEIKELDQFYTHKRMADGHLNKCKECTKADTKQDYRTNPEAHRAYEKVRGQTEERKAKQLEYQRRTRERKKLEYIARTMVNNAIRDGRLMKEEACSECGSTEKVEGHHDDYYKPLELIWLCFKCHRIRHGQTILTTQD